MASRAGACVPWSGSDTQTAVGVAQYMATDADRLRTRATAMRVATRADGTARLHRAGEVEYAWAHWYSYHSGAPRAPRGPAAGGAGGDLGTEGASCGAPGKGRCHGPSDGATSRSTCHAAAKIQHHAEGTSFGCTHSSAACSRS